MHVEVEVIVEGVVAVDGVEVVVPVVRDIVVVGVVGRGGGSNRVGILGSVTTSSVLPVVDG